MKPLLVSLALGVCGAVASWGQVVYHEKFDYYGKVMPGFTESCQMAEYPPSLKYLEFRPTKGDSVYQGNFFKLPQEAQGLTNYECEFIVRFTRDAVKNLDFRLEFRQDTGGAQPKTANCVVKIASDWCGIAGVVNYQPRLPATRVTLKDTPLYPLMGGQIYRCRVRVQGPRLEAFLEGLGKSVRIGTAEVGGFPLAGFNFSSAASFDLDDIIVRRLPAPPAGDFRTEDGVLIANRPAEYTLAFPLEATTARAKVRLGHPGEMRILLKWADNTTTPISVATFNSSVELPVIKDVTTAKDGKPVMESKQARERVALPDAGLTFSEREKKSLQLTCNIRPWIDGYHDPEIYGPSFNRFGLDRASVAAHWDQYEAASRHFFIFEVRRADAGITYWIDGRYAGRLDNPVPLSALAFLLPADGALTDAATGKVAADNGFLPLDLSALATPGVMATAKLPIKPGAGVIKGIPFTVAPGAGNLDLSVVAENLGSYWLECDNYLSRTAFSGMPESLMLAVPNTQYHKAYLLCAVADDPARDPIVTARLTRFLHPSAGGRGPAIADTTVTLPRPGDKAAKLPAGVTPLGEVEYRDGDGAHKSPLYLVEVPLDCGKIQDVIFQEKLYQMIQQPYLDFEVLGKTDRALQQLNREHKPDPASRSAVHIFGITLAMTPVEMQIIPARDGSAYTSEEKPSLEVVLRGRARAACRVAWEIRDVDGKVTDTGEEAATFAQPGEEKRFTVTPKVSNVGLYKASFRLLDGAKQLLVAHTAPFAVVAPDTRTAGYESPYFTWWFNGAHLTSKDITVVGPLLKMAGIRRTLVKNEAEGAPWKLTIGQFGNFTESVAPENAEKKRETYAKKIDDYLKAYPHATAANIFHESCNGGGVPPLELYDIPVPLPTDEKLRTWQQNQVTGAILTARLYREKYPQIRPTIVNTGDSLAGAAMLMRYQFPKELLTALGEESLGQTMPPEMYTAYNFWALRELARKMGYGEVPVDACYEWKGRNIRDLGERKSAAWRQRDALVAHAWGCKLVPVSGIIEPGNSYHNTVWGDDWMISRSPQNYPRMSYVTTAHLTRVLDGALYTRQLNTGTISVYALEFTRGNERIYALWTVRGTAEVTVTFAQDVPVQQSDMFGRASTVQTNNKALRLTVSGEPSYLVAPAAAATVTVGARAYPEDSVPAGVTVQVADTLADPTRWQLLDKPDDRLENVPKLGNTNYLPYRQLGAYQLRAVKDDEKGDCLEVELLQQHKVVPFLPEYTILKLKTPAPVAGTPTTVGVWVKGNAGWGQLMWEFEDAEGEKWLSCGTGGYWCDVYDWPKQASINFDGWNFVQFPITQASPVPLPNAGEVAQQWRSSGGGNSRIDYPIKLSGLAVNMTRQALNLTAMTPVTTVIRLKDLSAY